MTGDNVVKFLQLLRTDTETRCDNLYGQFVSIHRKTNTHPGIGRMTLFDCDLFVNLSMPIFKTLPENHIYYTNCLTVTVKSKRLNI